MTNFSKHALDVLEKNYYARDSNGKLIEKTPKDLMQRVARAIFPDDHELQLDLFDALMGQEVIFNSPVMFNIGLPTKQILAACWVGALEDNMDSIMRSAHITGIVFKYGSGMGLPMTNLRPKNHACSNSGYASGPISFMQIFNSVAEVIKSGGKRRAAFMCMNRVDHPDIFDIVTVKDTATGNLGTQPLENMNISIAATDEFMLAVKDDAEFQLQFQGTPYQKIKAAELFDVICKSAWKSADPGLFFIDTTNAANPLPSYGEIQTTNPCGEVPMHPWSCCNLGHINLNALTRFDGTRWHFDYERFTKLSELMAVALDRIIDLMDFPSPEFQHGTLETRPIALGYTGLAEVLYKLKIPYSNSQKFVSEITHHMVTTVIDTSITLAAEYGTTKTILKDKDHIAELILDMTGDYELYERCLEFGIRNSTWTTLAPTGTTSLVTDAKSYGIEPHFGLAYRKNFLETHENTVTEAYYINETFLDAIKHLNLDINQVVDDIQNNKGSCKNLPYIPNEIKRVFEVAHDLSPDEHLRIMAAAQPYISAAISKTINLPEDVSVDDIKRVYMSAWELGLKGVTVYRDNCKEFQPIDFGNSSSEPKEKGIAEFAALRRGESIPRGDSTDGGEIDAWKTACTKMYVAPGYSQDYKGVLIETFLAKKSGGGCESNLNAIALLISLALRKGIPVKDIVDELYAIVCPNCKSAKNKDINALSCPRAIAQTLLRQQDKAVNFNYLKDLSWVDKTKKASEVFPGILKSIKTPEIPKETITCTNCGAPMVLATGCITCPECGEGGCDHGRE